MKQYRLILIISAVILALGAGAIALFGKNYILALILFGMGAVWLGIVTLLLHTIGKKQQEKMDRVFRENDSAVVSIASNVSVPCAIVDLSGRITWRNNAFLSLFDGQDIHAAVPEFDGTNPIRTHQIVWNGSNFQVMNMLVMRESDRKLVFQYWLDRTEAAHYQRLYTEQRPYVALIFVDNYEELLSDTQIHSTAVLAEVERLIADLSKRLGGLYRRYDNGRFLLVLEAKQMQQLEQEKFALLEQAHHIDTGSSSSVSLSIGFGIAPRLAQSEQDARRAMELALGRGGDQVVVKDGTDYRFYGGKRQHDPRQSRVKARLFSKALFQLFENSGDVFIMGHRNSDMDCIGAALGVMTCANHVGAHAYIVLDAVNSTIEDAVQTLERSGAGSLIIMPDQAAEMMKEDSVLVVVDTQRASNTVAPELLKKAEHIVLIDHHRRNADYIDNATLHYLETRASSASEMVTEVMQYFADSVKPSAFTCSALLAGITVDTKQFAFNVGSRTFDAAGYLRRNGADLSSVKQMFQNDYASYVRCANVVEQAQIRRSGIAISLVPKNTPDAMLLAAQAADELLGIRGINAAFVLAETDEQVAISGRSYGKINVQVILEKLGGGGHLTMAGAQLRGVDAQQAIEKLEEVLEWYEQENPER